MTITQPGLQNKQNRPAARTLKQCMDDIIAQWHLSGSHDRVCRFDGKSYSLLNLRNLLEPWWDAEAWFTERGNIRFNHSGTEQPPAVIQIVKDAK